MKYACARFLGITVVIGPAAATRADSTVFNTFGAALPGYVSNGGKSIIGPGYDYVYPNGYTPAMGFIPTGSGSVTNVTVALGYVRPGNYHLAIYSDAAGLPGSPLASVLSTPPYDFGSPDRYVVSFNQSVSIEGGQRYWLVASTGASDWLAWNFTTSAVTVPEAFIPGPLGSAPWSLQVNPRTPAFSVDVIVPEPSAVTSILALAPLLTSRLRSRAPAGT